MGKVAADQAWICGGVADCYRTSETIPAAAMPASCRGLTPTGETRGEDMHSTVDRATRVADAGRGLDYRSSVWQGLATLCAWDDLWPEVDSRGRITGRVIGDESGYLNVDNEAMVDAGDIVGDERWANVEDKYADLLTEVEEEEVHSLYVRALDAALLGDMLGMTWSVEDHEGCDTAWMLQVVCSEQTSEHPMELDDAVTLLRHGHAPRGATPYPCTAEALLAIRTRLGGLD